MQSLPPGTEPTVGIVTVLYNSKAVLGDFLKSLEAQGDMHFRLYAVNNSPTKDDLRIVERWMQDKQIQGAAIQSEGNVGVAAGNNRGVALALADGCDYILLANNDTVFGEGVVRLLLNSSRGRSADVVSAKIYYHEAPDTIWYVYGKFNAWLMRVPHLGINQRDSFKYTKTRISEYAPTCFLLVRAGVFGEIGWMDERYFCYYDDTDFMWRLRKRGIGVLTETSAVVLHKVSSSTGGDGSDFSIYYLNRNRIYFIRKNLEGLKRWVALAYVLASRVPKIILLSPEKRRILLSALRDGLSMVVVR